MIRYRLLWLLALLWLLEISMGGCGSTGRSLQRLDSDSPEWRDLQSIRERIQPYDPSGRTEEGLDALDDWIESNASKDPALGHRLRADAHLDLWVFGQLAIGIDDAAATEVLDMIARRVDLADAFDRGPDQGSLDLVSQALADWVVEDYNAAGVDERCIAVASDILEIRLYEADSAGWFSNWPEASDCGLRPRLMLAALFYQRPGPWWGVSARSLGSDFLDEFGWLCGQADVTTIEEMAAQCGYWCAQLPESAPVSSVEPPWTPHELIEDEVISTVDQSFVSAASEVASSSEVEDSAQDVRGWDPTPGDVGYDLVSACGGEYFGLPPAGGLVLLDETIFVDIVLLAFVGQLLADIDADLSRGVPLAELSSSLIDRFSGRFLSSAVPVSPTPAWYRYDRRLELPRVRLPRQPEAAEEASSTGRLRIMTVRSDGIYLAVRPHLILSREDGVYRVVYAESESDYHYPGRRVVRLSAMNRLDAEQVEAGTVPQLARSLDEFEGWLESWEFGGRTSRLEGSSDEPADSESPLRAWTLFIDGSTLVSVLDPIVATLLDEGYESLDFEVLHIADSGLMSFPVEWTNQEPVECLRLRLTRGHFLGERTMAGEDSPSELFDLAGDCEDPYRVLYQEVLAQSQQGVFERYGDLYLKVDDEQVDVGTLIHLIEVLSYQRETTHIENDLDLLEAPPREEGDEVQRLIPGRILLVL